MPTVKPDGSYALGCPLEQQKRTVLLNEPHAIPLRDFVSGLRKQTDLGCEIPDFDPLDGGIHAKVLFLLEAPGPKAVKSGFISRDNPDSTARRFRNLLQNAGIARDQTAIWNIVPYYIGNKERSKIRAANSLDIRNCSTFLLLLLTQFSNLEAIVLLGRKAQKSKKIIAQFNDIRIFETFHFSDLAINGHPTVLPTIQKDLLEIKEFISS